MAKILQDLISGKEENFSKKIDILNRKKYKDYL
jgi:hypothetical protein